MPQIKEIKLRIESVTKTKKLTQAMKMVAAAKFKRSQQAVTKTKPYIGELDTVLEQLLTRMDADEIPALFNKENTAEKSAIIIVSSDRGLCGGFNASLFKKVDEYINSVDISNVDAYLIGNKAIAAYKKKAFNTVTEFPFYVDTMTPRTILETFTHVLESFETDACKDIQLFYNKFLSGVSFETKKETLLPFELDQSKMSDSHSDFFYEPSKSQILAKVGKEIILYKLYRAMLESKASEEGSRMAAMEAATDNAGEMIKDLTLLYNRSRQAQITKEISEIVAGATASS